MKLCIRCLGRRFGLLGKGMTNIERGELISCLIDCNPVREADCELCGGIFDNIDRYAEMCLKASEEYEYDSFLVGAVIDDEILDKEKEIMNPLTEPLKSELTRELGKRIQELTNKDVEFSRPDITFIVDTIFERVELEVRSTHIYGRYWKFSRDLLQNRYLCKRCKGMGCEYCRSSIEGIIGERMKELSCAEDYRFHGAGREDIDVRMLGNGRPFILELLRPKNRKFDLPEEIRGSELRASELRFADRKEVAILKSARFPKRYRAEISMEKVKPYQKVNKEIISLKGVNIQQRTPIRVSHSRSDIVRKRRILNIEVCGFQDNKLILEIEAESGTYIKEFVNGDSGRTRPSISELLGVKCKVQNLDVIEIGDKWHDEEIPWFEEQDEKTAQEEGV